jgi:hypothetical protein
MFTAGHRRARNPRLPAALVHLPDPRVRRGVRHRLPVVISAAICAAVADYRSYTATADRIDDVPATTNEITRFAPVLDQIGDLRNAVTTVDALRCRRDHLTCLAERGADFPHAAQASRYA